MESERRARWRGRVIRIAAACIPLLLWGCQITEDMSEWEKLAVVSFDILAGIVLGALLLGLSVLVLL